MEFPGKGLTLSLSGARIIAFNAHGEVEAVLPADLVIAVVEQTLLTVQLAREVDGRTEGGAAPRYVAGEPVSVTTDRVPWTPEDQRAFRARRRTRKPGARRAG